MIALAYSLGARNIFIAIIAGVLPALLWLWYWRREDALHPEPRTLIAKTFIAGMFAAVAALFIELSVLPFIPLSRTSPLFLFTAFTIALIEESMKYLFAYLVALKTRALDEPVDALIYMITAALGFSALENVLFILGALSSKGAVAAAIISNSRFLGATLLHIVSSAAIGGGMALYFYEKEFLKRRGLILGFILAIGLHTAYDFFIMPTKEGTNAISVFLVILAVWMLVLSLIFFFEKVKKIRPTRRYIS